MSLRCGAAALDSEPPLLEEAVFRPGEAEVFGQGLAFVLAAEEAAPLQFGDDAIDEIVETNQQQR